MTGFSSGRNNRFYLVVCFMFTFTAFTATAARAQLNDYERLLLKTNQPGIYGTMFTLPGSSRHNVQLAAAFRINYQLLTFKKVNKPGIEKYYATPSLSIHVYRSPRKNLGFKEQVSVVDLESVARKSWSDTIYAKSYTATTNSDNFATVFLQVQLPPGHYTYILQFGGSGPHLQTSGTRNIHVNAYGNSKNGEVILAGAIQQTDEGVKLLNLVNRGSRVSFSQDFYALIHLPGYSADKKYQVEVYKVQTANGDTTQIKKVAEQPIDKSQILTDINPQLTKTNDQLYLKLTSANNGYAYALVQIPSHRFSEAEYKIEVVELKSGKTVATKLFKSVWFDKPVSLHSVDLAIEMLRFIVDRQTLKQIGAGSAAAERKKLQEFWSKKDPTPDTEFNELKAEYYRRIDYAYQHYSSGDVAGFNTDRGRIYILYGPPENIERVYPTEGPTKEIWTYENRRFVFKATSGFGDFKLISN